MMPYCPLCNEYHSKFWDCAIRKVTTHNSSHPPMGIITDEKGVVKAIGESETNTEWLRGFYAYETAEGMRLIDAWLTEWAIGGL